MQIVAPGGVGKTQLTKKWREKLLDRDDHGAVRVYDWSFYSQGSREQVAVSPDRTTSQRDTPTTGN